MGIWVSAIIPTDPPTRRKIDVTQGQLLHCGDGSAAPSIPAE
jgi:hypothetical protein